MNFKRDLPDSGPGFERCHGLAAYLRALVPSPRRGDPIVQPLRLLVEERLGRKPRLYREIVGCGAVTDEGLAWAWHAAAGIVDAYNLASRRQRQFAEENARVAIQALHKHCLARIESLQGHVYLLDDEGDGIRVLDEYRLLGGVLSICLLEAGDLEGRREVREGAAECLDDEDTAGPIRVLIGLSGYPGDETWRPGQGCLGVFRNAVSDGHKSLLGTVAATLKEDARDKGAKPAPASSLREILAAPEPVAVRIDDGPSLMVLASVQHLPGAAEDGKGTRGSAVSTQVRSDYAPFAGKRWPLQAVGDLVEAREILVGEFPHAERIIDAILRDVAGRRHVFVKPLLLVGPAGCGKTRLARRVGEVLGLNVQIVPCAGVADASALGTSRQWSTQRACLPLAFLKQLSSATALFVWDELEKAGTSSQNGKLQDAILPLLNLQDASHFFDPMLECPVDLSAVSHLATANSLDGMGAALRDRFRIFHMPEPQAKHLPALVVGVLDEIRAERGVDEQWLPDLSPDEVELIQGVWSGGSVRLLKRVLETVVTTRESRAVRH